MRFRQPNPKSSCVGSKPDPRSPQNSKRLGPRALVLAATLVSLALGLALLDATQVDAAGGRRPILPKVEGPLLSGEGTSSTAVLRKRNGLLLIYSASDAYAEELAGVVSEIEKDAAKRNLGVLGVTRPESTAASKQLAERAGLRFPVIVDPKAQFISSLGLPEGKAAAVAVDAEGYIVQSFVTDPANPFEAGVPDRILREALHVPLRQGGGPVLGVAPRAPDFKVKGLDGKDVTLDQLDGDVVLVIFFLHTCPHCHEMLRFLKKLRAQLGRDDFAVVPISLQNKPGAVEAMVREQGLDYPVYLDPDNAAQKAYPATLSVPQMFLLDREHRIIATHEGSDGRTQALLLMSIRKALGLEAPILLPRQGYAGEEACRICHTTAHETWSLTTHAYAFETLVEHGQDSNEECLQCHTVGFGEPGGYNPAARQTYLEGVQCENCHGRGGPHQSPEFAKQGMEQTCKTCHTPEHSLRFSFAERLPIISHAANAEQIKSLSMEQRRALLEKRDKRERTLFDSADFVGSGKCAECHTKEFERWQASPHSGAFTTLIAKESQSNKECQACHTTGFEKPGGFPAGGDAMHGVGCESCHGPGGNHVAQSTPTAATIFGLTDKCDSCVILQICGSCHDDANDPNFEFEVEDKIDLIRHGFRDREPPTASLR